MLVIMILFIIMKRCLVLEQRSLIGSITARGEAKPGEDEDEDDGP